MNRLIERVTPFLAERFRTQTIEKIDGHDRYEIDADGDTIVLRASSRSAFAAGYYRFLRQFCDMDLSPCGNTEVYAAGAPRVPQKKVTQVLRHDLRVAFSYAIFSHDAFAWDWDQWQWHLDYLAMQGVNAAFMPVGQEAVWYYSALDLGVRREDAMEYLSSPSYYPLQLAGKIDSFLPVTDTNFLKAQIALGKQITERMRELGIEPILPAFTGHVPKYLKGYFPQSAMFFVTSYDGFPFTYRVDPNDPLFGKVAAALASKQTDYFGTAEYYLADPFYGVQPRGRDDSVVSETGKAVLAAIRAIRPDAVWVQHACELTQTLNCDVPRDGVLILDTDGTHRGECGELPYIRGISVSTGGHTTLCGDAAGILSLAFPTDAAGIGVFSDYTLANPLLSACAYRRLTEDAPQDAAAAFTSEALRRWGSEDERLREAAALLLASCYNADSPAVPVGSVPATRPGTEIAHTAPNDTLALHYDNRTLCASLEKLLASEGDYTDAYVFDVCDVTRQLLSNFTRRLFADAIEGYRKRDGRLFETATNAFIRALSDMDRLLCTRREFNLRSHLDAAAARAEGKMDRQNFEVSLLAAITLFGPMQQPLDYDIRWKEWSDLTGDYYAKRWHALFSLLAENFKKRGQISTNCRGMVDGRSPQRGGKFYKQLDKTERNWILSCTPKKMSDEDTLDVAAELLEKYKPLVERDNI